MQSNIKTFIKLKKNLRETNQLQKVDLIWISIQ
jgi:hypothetical protein